MASLARTSTYAVLFWLLLSSSIGSLVVNVNYAEERMIRFTHEGAQNFSQILLDSENQQLVVGGRDFIFRLGLDDLLSLDSHEWVSSNETIEQCKLKGQSAEDCHNYITVLHKNKDQLLACGTNAFAPLCRHYSAQDLSQVLKEGTGLTKSPFSPKVNTTSLLTEEGDLFVGSKINFGGTDSAFLRSGTRPLLRTPQYSREYVDDPQFLASFEIGDFIYFFFRETAIEHLNCGQSVFTRVGRVCKKDSGSLLMKQSWTTFLKARLNCSLPGQLPFYYNEAHGVAYLASRETFFLSFTTAQNSIFGSAVCSFDLADIEETFNGPLTGNLVQWKKGAPPSSRFRCDSNNTEISGPELFDLKRYQQTYNAVPSTRPMPLYNSELERIVQLQVDEVVTLNGEVLNVVFVVSLEGVLKKVVDNPATNSSCVVEELHVFRDGEVLNRLLLVKEKQALFAATSRGVVKIPLNFCGRFRTQEGCLNSGDPYCGWNTLENVCASLPQTEQSNDGVWLQGEICKKHEGPVNGSWGRWSSWRPCTQGGTAAGEMCSCRQRNCDSPAPSDGGRACIGLDLEVANCTQHGGWTDWSEWSGCSAQCGPGFQHRSRTCTNPRPAFGGRDCIGTDREERGCPNNPICHPTAVASLPEHSIWSDWGNWSACSVPCGGGFQFRKRKCAQQGKARQCELGCSREYRTCNAHECPDVRTNPEWSEWHIIPRANPENSTSETASGGWRERRFRYQCAARVANIKSMRLVTTKSERFCQNHSDCSDTTETTGNSTWNQWSSWGPCSAPCGGGTQTRERICSQGEGRCPGSALEEQQCNMSSCPVEGWSEWTNWSACDGTSGEQHRKRHCIADEQWKCLGGVHSRESRACLSSENLVGASFVGGCGGVDTSTFAGTVIGAYLIGLATMIIAVWLFNKRHRVGALMDGNGSSMLNGIQGIPVPKHLASQPLVPAECNTYVPSANIKAQFNTLASPPMSPVKGAATIKRANTFRAQLGEDQNF